MSEYKFEEFKNGCRIAVSREHTFGTDAFLLADFAQIRHKDRVVDLGTGCGIIAMLIKMRYEPKEVFGVDIQEQAIEQFEISIKESGLENIYPVLTDIKAPDYEKLCGSFDCVVTNPPYKLCGTGIESELDAHRIARHEVLCNIDDICRTSARLLNFGGRLCICNRPERLADVITAMKNNGIEPKKLRFVARDESTAPWLFLIEGRKGGNPYMQVMPSLFMNTDGGVSEELRSIYGHTQP